MHPEEVEKRRHAVSVMEHLRGEVAVEELNSITDRLGQGRFRERSCEWFEIKLQDKVSIGSTNQSFNQKQNLCLNIEMMIKILTFHRRAPP